MRRFIGKILLILIVVLLAFGYWRFYWIFGEGVKAGELNYVVKKGYIFKTYEGKLIQSGFRGGTPGAIQSYDFEFSVTSEHIAQQLMVNSGKVFELHYKEYMGAIPWRGNTAFIVDSILSMRDGSGAVQPISPSTQK